MLASPFKPEVCGVTRHNNSNWTKIGGKCQIEKFKWDILSGETFIKSAKNSQF